jgi:hypothetical protein
MENRPPWVGDVTLREDECRVRHKSIAQGRAALRNAVARLLRKSGRLPLVAASEFFAEHRDDAIKAVLMRIK